MHVRACVRACACVNVCVWRFAKTIKATELMPTLKMSAQVKISAWTHAGQGPFSAYITERTGEGVPQVAPANLEVTSVKTSNSRVSLSWAAVEEADVPGVLFGYTIAVRMVRTREHGNSTYTAT